MTEPLQTHHVHFSLKRRGNEEYTWCPCRVNKYESYKSCPVPYS